MRKFALAAALIAWGVVGAVAGPGPATFPEYSTREEGCSDRICQTIAEDLRDQLAASWDVYPLEVRQCALDLIEGRHIKKEYANLSFALYNCTVKYAKGRRP